MTELRIRMAGVILQWRGCLPCMERVLALHGANPDLIVGTSFHPLSTPKSDP